MTRLEGHACVLVSPVYEFIKIGATDYAPFKRIKEINPCEPYKNLGPWSLHDFRQVLDGIFCHLPANGNGRLNEVKNG
jgi:hypothetical protein